jgi:hypothetical protein
MATKGALLKLLPPNYRSIRKFIRFAEVYFGHWLHDFFYIHAYHPINAIFPHKYWIPTLFLAMCLAVHHVHFSASSRLTLTKLVLSVDAATMTTEKFRGYCSRVVDSIQPPREKTPEELLREESIEALRNPPKWPTILGRVAKVMLVLFGGLVFQHLLITLGYVYMSDTEYESVVDKFVFLMNNGMSTESIFSCFVSQIVTDQYYAIVETVLKVDERRALVESSVVHLVRPFLFAVSFFIIRRILRNFNSSVLPFFDAVPLLIMVVVVGLPYFLRGTRIKMVVMGSFAGIAAWVSSVVAFLFDHFNHIGATSFVLLFAYAFTARDPGGFVERKKVNPVVRAISLVPVLILYGLKWLRFELRFDWWFGAGLAISLMKQTEFPAFLYDTTLPVFQSFRDLCWWFPFFDTAREMAFAVRPPLW